jgi:hypothetical protein
MYVVYNPESERYFSAVNYVTKDIRLAQFYTKNHHAKRALISRRIRNKNNWQILEVEVTVNIIEDKTN